MHGETVKSTHSYPLQQMEMVNITHLPLYSH